MSAFRIRFTVDGNPVPKQRAQVGSHGAYYPERSARSKRLSYPEYKELVRLCCWKELIKLGINPHVNYPTGWGSCRWGLSVQVWIGAGDLGNTIGSIEDALQETKELPPILWKNDSQVVHYGNCNLVRTTPKQYRGVEVEAWVLEE